MSAAAVQSESDKLFEMLSSRDPETRRKAHEQIRDQRGRTIAMLTAVIKDRENHDFSCAAVKDAIAMLGHLRAKEATKVLVEYIAVPEALPYFDVNRVNCVPTFGFGDIGKPIEWRLPAIGALISIGEPAVDDVIEELATTNSAITHEACLAVLYGLRKRVPVRERLAKALEDAPPEQRESLKRGLKMLDERLASEQNQDAEYWRRKLFGGSSP